MTSEYEFDVVVDAVGVIGEVVDSVSIKPAQYADTDWHLVSAWEDRDGTWYSFQKMSDGERVVTPIQDSPHAEYKFEDANEYFFSTWNPYGTGYDFRYSMTNDGERYNAVTINLQESDGGTQKALRVTKDKHQICEVNECYSNQGRLDISIQDYGLVNLSLEFPSEDDNGYFYCQAT
ncbi:hypothetical protein JCM19231_4249 [Vibrio ishigakensis]|uniref:Uncharacterized protein n=1 Tax=Vibrio ishigakensis TaxID=1481914 RepID=A0A0B8P1X2_9VIBR|nr:hypothetical protein JCM19231_4249 [Vibrio ishigakensis]